MKLKVAAKYKKGPWGEPQGGWARSGGKINWSKEKGGLIKTKDSLTRVFEDEIGQAITAAVKRAAASAAQGTLSSVMQEADRVYNEVGLDKHELTGNTRNSIVGAAIQGRKVLGHFQRMPNTPRATEPMLSLRPGDSRYHEWHGYRYFLVEHYRTGKKIRYPLWRVENTSGGYAYEESIKFLNKIKAHKNALVEIHLHAMTETYRPELLEFSEKMKRIIDSSLFDSLKEEISKRIRYNKDFTEFMRAAKAAKAAKAANI